MTFPIELIQKNKSFDLCSIIVTGIFFVTCLSIALIIDEPSQDSDILFYYFAGKQILLGEGSNVQIFNAPVGWPILLAAFDSIVGDPFTTAKLFSAVFSAGIIIFSYLIIRNVFSQKIALLGQIIIAVNPMLHLESIITHSEMLPVFLIFFSLYFITKKNISQRQIIFCGILLGLSFMLRPQSLLIGLGVLSFILLSVKKQKKKFIVFFIMAFLITISPLMLYNISTTGNIIDNDPNFYLVHDSGVSNSDYFKNKIVEDGFSKQPNLLGVNEHTVYSDDYFKNLLYHNPHLVFNLGAGHNNFSTIPFIDFSGLVLVLGGIIGLFIRKLPKKYYLVIFGLPIILTAFLLLTENINTFFFLPIIISIITIVGFGYRKIEDNIKPLVIIPLIFMISISFVKIASAQDLFAMLIIPSIFSSFFILNTIPNIIKKIQDTLKINLKILTSVVIIIIILTIVSLNLVSSVMVENHALFGIPVDYHNLLKSNENHELIALDFKEIGDVLSKQPNIENKIVMAGSMNYAYYANSKFMYTNFTEGDKNDTINSFISRINWSDYELKFSNMSSIPQDRNGNNNSSPDYLIYKINSKNNENLQILEDPDNSEIPKNFELIYISNDNETIVYKIHDEDIDN